MTICFGLKRQSSGHHYKNFKIRYDTVKIMNYILHVNVKEVMHQKELMESTQVWYKLSLLLFT